MVVVWAELVGICERDDCFGTFFSGRCCGRGGLDVYGFGALLWVMGLRLFYVSAAAGMVFMGRWLLFFYQML